MEAERSLGLASFMSAHSIEGINKYPGPMTQEMVLEAHGHWRDCVRHMSNAEKAAPDAASAQTMKSYATWGMIACPRQHTLSEFDPVAVAGERGAVLRATIEG